MTTPEKTEGRQGHAPALWLLPILAIAYALGIHLGQIAAILSPRPENVEALLVSALFSDEIFGSMFEGAVFAVMAVQLSGYPAFRTPSRIPALLREQLRNMDRRHYAALIGCSVFALPFVLITLKLGVAILLPIGLMILAGPILIHSGVMGRLILLALWLTAGFMHSDLPGASQNISISCEPGARIKTDTGATYPCASMQYFSLYSGLLVRDGETAVYLPLKNVDKASLETATNRSAVLLFPELDD